MTSYSEPDSGDTDDSDALKDVHARAIARFDAIWKTYKDACTESLEDRRFYSILGAQWDDQWSQQFENSPRMEVNKTHAAIMRIVSEYRNNRITVDFRPKDEDGSDEVADTLDGLFRADEEESGAQEAYDMAFEEGVGGGRGGWRLRACYEDEYDPDNDYQRVKFEPIPDADQRLFFDLASVFQDKRDAKHAFLLTPMEKDAFEDEYPDAAPANFKDWPDRPKFDWYRDDDVVYIAEYYEIEEAKSTKVVLVHPVIDDGQEKALFDPEPEMISEMKAEGWSIVRRRKLKRPRVHKYILSGKEVLEDCGLIAGCHIPLVPYYGKRWYVEGVERWAGHVRYAKDPQRIYNAEVSQLAEIAGASPHERPIFDPEQVQGLERDWAEANIKRLPYALAKALRNEDGSIAQAGPIGNVSPPSVPQALAALVQLAGTDVNEILGSNEQLDNVPSNTSDDAIEMVHSRADAKTFIYIDNLAAAHRRSGEIWLSMASELYIEKGRTMAAMDEQGSRQYAKIGSGIIQPSGAMATVDFSKVKMQVAVDVGPSSTTRRDATTRKLVKMAELSANAQDMETATACITAALAGMDGEGIDDLKKWIRMKAIRSGILQPTEDEKAEMLKEAQNQQPDPQAMLAQGMTAQAMAEAEKAKAGTIKTLADTELTKAKTAETLAGVQREDRQQFIDAVSSDADRLTQHAANMQRFNAAGQQVQ